MINLFRSRNLIYEVEQELAEQAGDRGGRQRALLNRNSIELVKTEGGPFAWLGLLGVLKSGLPGVVRPGGVGSEPTRAREFREIVAVGDEKEYWASGILLKGGYVITAGHVHTLGIRERVAIGTNAPISLLCGSGFCSAAAGAKWGRYTKEFTVKRSVRHPFFWNDPFFTNDLAVLKLEDYDLHLGLDLDELASEDEFKHEKIGKIVGYGTSNAAGSTRPGPTSDPNEHGYGVRSKVNVPILHEEELANRYGFARHLGFDRRREFVAAAPLFDADACSGDSGGGFFVKVCCRWKLIGMVSRQFGLRGEQCGAGSIYLRLDKYRECIRKLIAHLDDVCTWAEVKEACARHRDEGSEDRRPSETRLLCSACGR